MDPRERYFDPEETIRMALESLSSRLWSALPGVIQAVTNNGNTVEVQPAININIPQMNGTYKSMQLPVLTDVPICWQGGGGATWTFPVAAGDECLVIFASRCIDSWWENGFATPTGQKGADGGPVNLLNTPWSSRTHNLSDGFALVGVRSKKRAFSSFDASTVRLRTDDDSCYFEFDPVNKSCNMVFPGGVNINGVAIDHSANLSTSGDVTSKGKVLATHVHSGVQAGGSNTGGPV